MGEAVLDRLLNQLWDEFFTDQERRIAEQAVSLNWDLIEEPNHKLAFLYAAADALSRKHQERREDTARREVLDRLENIAVRVEGIRAEQKSEMFDQYMQLEREKQATVINLAHEWMARQEMLRGYEIAPQPAALPATGQQNVLPAQAAQPTISYHVPQLSYTNCIRHHPPSKEFPAGRPGPGRCVLTIPQEDGIHMRCLVAYTSQNPGEQGFARLPYQIFHAELLRQGDCPRPLSRSVTRRIPGMSWLFLKPEICPLACGEDIVIEYGKK